jgi:hypothetical protein
VWLLAVLTLLPSALWYWHAHSLFLHYHNTFGIFTSGFLKFSTPDILANPLFYGQLLSRTAIYHLAPIVFLAMVYGLVQGETSRIGNVFHVWLAGILFYILVAARGVLIGHYQYVLPVVPAAAPIAAAGALALIKRFFSSSSRTRSVLAGIGTIVVLLLSRSVVTTSIWENDRQTGLAVARVTTEGSRIIVVDNQMDEFSPEESMTPPNVFYFSDRKGWYRSMAWLNPASIEDLHTRGGDYLVVTGNSVTSFKNSFPALQSYLTDHFEAIFQGSQGIIFDLGKEKGGGRKSGKSVSSS